MEQREPGTRNNIPLTAAVCIIGIMAAANVTPCMPSASAGSSLQDTDTLTDRRFQEEPTTIDSITTARHRQAMSLFTVDPDTLSHLEAVALLDSIQVLMVINWFNRNPDGALRMGERQLAVAASLTENRDDSTYVEIAGTGMMRLEYSQLEKHLVRGSMTTQALLDSLEAARGKYRLHGMKKQEIITNLIIGELELAVGESRFRHSFTAIFQALEAARVNGYITWQSHALTSLGRFFRWIPRFDLSEKYLEAALELGRQANDPLAMFRALQDLGILRLMRNQPGRALDTFTELRELGEEHGILMGGFFPFYVGEALRMLNRYEGALEHMEEALSWARHSGFVHAIHQSTASIASIYEDTGRLEEAKSFYRDIVGRTDDRCLNEYSWRAAYRLGVIAEQEGNRRKAVDRYAQAISCIERLRMKVSLSELQFSYLADKMLPYEQLIDLTYDLYAESGRERNYAEIALEYSERSRMRMYTGEEPAIVESETVRELLDQENRLLEKMNELRGELLDPSVPQQAKSRLFAEMEKLERSFLGTKLSLDLLRPPSGYRDTPGMALVLDLVSEQAIDSSTAVLEYFIGSESTYGWIITRDGIDMRQLTHLPSREHPALLYRDLLLQDDTVHARKIGARITRDLLAPFSDMLTGVSTLVIVPDNVLHYLPFESLPMYPAADGSERTACLVEHYDISYAPSMTALLQLRKRAGSRAEAGSNILAIGDPVGGDEQDILDRFTQIIEGFTDNRDGQRQSVLGHEYFTRLKDSKREVRTIASMFPAERSETLLGPRATERAVKSAQLNTFDIIHFATHGVYDDENPDLSGLILSQGDGEEDDFLLAGEVRRFQLDSPLVVLSGCQTGLGRLVKGEGIDGLSRAFFEAGASSLVVSLWKIEDRATADFMELFYRGYLSGAGTCRALSEAKRVMMAEGENASAWAPFVLIGDYR